MNAILENHREQIMQKMHKYCLMFCTIGTPLETPRYLNFGEIYTENELYFLRIQSTQRQNLYFDIEITENEFFCLSGDINPFWNAFKQFRTEFLQNNYPTISTI